MPMAILPGEKLRALLLAKSFLRFIQNKFLPDLTATRGERRAMRHSALWMELYSELMNGAHTTAEAVRARKALEIVEKYEQKGAIKDEQEE